MVTDERVALVEGLGPPWEPVVRIGLLVHAFARGDLAGVTA